MSKQCQHLDDSVVRTFGGHRIIRFDNDVCHECRRRVLYVLTEQESRIRHWHTLDWGVSPYLKHECPRRVPRQVAA